MTYALLVPCFNASCYIEGFLQNLAELMRPFDEVIFYDDGSTDGTAEILRSAGFNVIKNMQNNGPAYARNKLAENSTCDWFHFHDIDDRLDPLYLLKTAAIAEQAVADVILCNVDWYDAVSEELVLQWKYSNIELNKNPVAYTIGHPIGGINGLYRKSKFMETGGFNPAIRIWEDADLHVKLAGHNARFYVIEEVLAVSLRYANSASTDQAAGWLTRLGLLEGYHQVFNDKTDRLEIGKQAQVAAGTLILCGEFRAARQALRLSERCLLKVPGSSSKIWVLAKIFIPGRLRIELRILQLKFAFRISVRKQL